MVIEKLISNLYNKISHLNALKNKRFSIEFQKFQELFNKSSRNELTLEWSDRYPIFNEKSTSTSFDRHYIYHTAWAARLLASSKPEIHYDIGSSLYFVSFLSAFIPIKFFDYRPANIKLPNLISDFADLTSLSFGDNSISSLSCMHVVEHVGLGRYGDPIDPNGDLKAIEELTRVIANNGRLLFVVPIGKPRICFNAHRIYDPVWVESIFKSYGLTTKEFAVIPDHGHLLRYQLPGGYQDQNYACGCFDLLKQMD